MTTLAIHASPLPACNAPALLRRLPSRGERVLALNTAIVALSMLDLALTLGHMTGEGMLEANPLVHWLAQQAAATGLPWAEVWTITVFKVASVGFCIAVLNRLRARWTAEAGAWIAILVLVALTIKWVLYIRFIASLDAETVEVIQASEEWLRLV